MLKPTSGSADELYRRALEAQSQARYEEAAALLAAAARVDHVPALSLLGAQMLSGRGMPPDPPNGIVLIRRAAELGGAYASAVMGAARAAQGDWPAALDELQRAAELGHAPARTQLGILAGDPDGGLAPAGCDPAELRRRVDLAAWRAPVAVTAISGAPAIKAAAGLAPAAMCEWLASRARARLQPAQLFDTAAFRPVQSKVRTNSVAGFTLADGDLVVMLLRERLAATAGVTVPAMEPAQVFHYAVGQEFGAHFDFLEEAHAGHAASLAERGQRIATLLVYLNEAFEGGETEFPALGLKHRGRRGDALLFWNTDADGRPDRRTLHAGLPPTSGEKWLFSQWVRERPARR